MVIDFSEIVATMDSKGIKPCIVNDGIFCIEYYNVLYRLPPESPSWCLESLMQERVKLDMVRDDSLIVKSKRYITKREFISLVEWNEFAEKWNRLEKENDMK